MNTESQTPTEFFKVSYSSLNTKNSCARKFEFSKLYPRKKFDGDMFAADVGTCLHHGYQDFLINGDPDRAMMQMLRSYPHESAWDQDNSDRSVEAAVVTLDEMIESSELAGWEIAMITKPDGTVAPAIEVPFEIRIKGLTMPDGRGVAFVGFIDAIMRHKKMDHFRTLDIKTHRRYAKDASVKARVDEAKYKFDGQQVPYGIVLQHITGEPVDRFEVLYYDVFVDVADPVASLYRYWKDSTDVQEWLLNTVMDCKQITEWAHMDYFPRTNGGCLAYNRPCYFLKLCESRDRKAITAWLLEGEDADVRAEAEPWIVAEIDPYGDEE